MSLSSFQFPKLLELSEANSWIIGIFACICAIISFFATDTPGGPKVRNPQGYKRINLREPHDPSEDHTRNASSINSEHKASSYKVKSLWIYPVKSCRGIELSRGTVVSTGMQHDRQFSFAQLRPRTVTPDTGDCLSEPKWQFITQRQYPLLTQVKTEIWMPISLDPPDHLHHGDFNRDGILIIRFPSPNQGWRRLLTRIGTGFRIFDSELSFQVPLYPTDEQIKMNGYALEQMSIWKDSPLSLNMSTHVPKELKQFLGISYPMGLFRVAPGQERQVHRCAPKEEELGWQPVTGFADAVSSLKSTLLRYF